MTDSELNSTVKETWPTLLPLERRIIGVLVEKAKTVPDSYPLTLNALVTGCNQKSNRDPVMDTSDVDIEEVIPNLKKLGLVQQILGSGRTDKFRHVMYDSWKVEKLELAVLTELLLRGAQTEGELRTRASRMEPIDDLDTLRKILEGLQQRGMIIYLTPQGRRGTLLTHNFYPEEELERLRARAERISFEEPAISAPARSSSDLEARVASLEKTIAEMKEEWAAFQAKWQ